MSLSFNLSIALIAIIIDGAVGYPGAIFARIRHPVVWLGTLIRYLDSRFNSPSALPEKRRRAGFNALVLLLFVAVGAALVIQLLALVLLPRVVAVLLLALLTSTCQAQRSLDQHVRAVREALETSGLAAGRAAVAVMVDRDTALLNHVGVCRAAIKSLATSFATGVVAPALYSGIAGLPGALFFKATNTADSMIGQTTPRHADFGRAVATLDDALMWPAARLSAYWIVIAAFVVPGASGPSAWRALRDEPDRPLPRDAYSATAMAGALDVRVDAIHTPGDGTARTAPPVQGRPPDADAIGKALVIYRVACGFNALALLVLAFAFAFV